MADSDEEYDRRRARDKFRRERSDYQDRRGDDRGRREDFPERESWNNRERGGRREYREYDPRGRRDRYSPPPQRHDISPPMKRVRMDWGDDYGSGHMGGYDMGYPGGRGGGNMMGGPPGNWGGRGMHPDMMHGDMEPGMTQPPMKTFKQFLSEQNDNIDDQEAVKIYNEYKQDFKRQQLSEFFITHKEEEWFKSKYHPEEFERRKQEQQEALNKRLSVFLELHRGSWLEDVSVDLDKAEQIIRFLDAVVIKLEGGNDNDLRSLDEPQEEEKPRDSESVYKIVKDEKPAQAESEKDETKDGKSKEEKGEDVEKETDKDEDTPKKKKKKSRKENDDDEFSDDSSSSGSSNSDESSEDDDDEEDDDEKGKKDVKEKEKRKRKKSKKSSDNEEPDSAKLEVKSSEAETKEKVKEELSEDKDSKKDVEAENVGSSEKDAEEAEDGEKIEVPPKDQKPLPLHKTCSIFLRNLPPTITKQEVEAMFRKFDGFLRVAIADPSPERRFFRRGWVTYERNVNVKRICFEVSEIKLRDCDLGAIVNRDLIRRIRSVNGITSHKQVARADIKVAVKIIQNLDNQRNLWKDIKEAKTESISMKTKNPLLDNISDYLIEEASAEEEELLGISIDEGGQPNASGDSVSTLERDETLIKVLDRLLFYLRIVHSIDYYNYSDYPNEDEMPNRCGIMHARGPPPKDAVTQQEIDEYLSFFESKICGIVNPLTKVPKDDAVRLGLKDPQAEVEKFVKANSQEVGPGKWLCPLSGKKFKGPDFVRKHIFNKHHEKITEVETEAAYFNNYLLDPKRPHLPEHPFNRQQNSIMGGPPGHMPGHRDMPGRPGFMGPGFMGPPFGGPPMPMFGGASGFGGRNAYQDMHSRGGGNFGKLPGHGRNVNKPRKMISYNDLDEPKEQDFF